MLKKTLQRGQWFALVMLFVGVATVQLQHGKQHGKPVDMSTQGPTRKQYPMVGLLAVIASTFCSGFAGLCLNFKNMVPVCSNHLIIFCGFQFRCLF
jgi:drug/metabolite transporter (DMT)-like permease